MPQHNPLQHQPAPERADFTQVSAAAYGRKLLYYATVALVGTALGITVARQPLLLVLGAVLGLGAALAILAKPFWGLLLYTVLFTLRLGEVYPILGHLHLERMIGALTVVGLFVYQHRLKGSLFLDASKQTKRLLLFTAAVGMSVPLAFWRTEAISGFVDVLKIIAFYVMIVHLVDTQAKMRQLVLLFCLTVVWVGGNSLYSYLTGHSAYAQGIDRATGSTSAAGNANTLGATMASAFPLFLLLAQCPQLRKATRFLLVFSLGVLLVTLAVTGSRASLLGFLAGLVYLWKRSQRRLLFGFLGLAFVVAGFVILPTQYKDRYATITSSQIDESSQARLVTWLTGFRLFVQRPIFGVGVQCFAAANRDLTGSWLSSHSLYLQVLAELGIVGTVAFVAFFGEMLGLNRRTRRSLEDAPMAWTLEKAILDGIFAGLIVLLVSGIFGHSLLRRTWYVFAAIDLVIWRLWWQANREDRGATEVSA